MITQEEVKQKLANINASKAMGPDHIPGIVLKTLAEEISIPLTKIFNKSISEGTVPDKWKIAEVSAIYKKATRLTQETIAQSASLAFAVKLWNLWSQSPYEHT